MPIPIVCQSVARAVCIMHYCVNMTDWLLHSVMALHRYVELYCGIFRKFLQRDAMHKMAGDDDEV